MDENDDHITTYPLFLKSFTACMSSTQVGKSIGRGHWISRSLWLIAINVVGYRCPLRLGLPSKSGWSMTALVRRIMSGCGHNDDRSLVLTVKSLMACASEAHDHIDDLAENVARNRCCARDK